MFDFQDKNFFFNIGYVLLKTPMHMLKLNTPYRSLGTFYDENETYSLLPSGTYTYSIQTLSTNVHDFGVFYEKLSSINLSVSFRLGKSCGVFVYGRTIHVEKNSFDALPFFAKSSSYPGHLNAKKENLQKEVVSKQHLCAMIQFW